MKTYLDVTVRILSELRGAQGDAGGSGAPPRYRVLIDSPKGQGESSLELPFALDELSGAVFGVAQTLRSVASVTPPASAPNVRESGRRLYEALFNGEAKSILDRTIGAAEERQDTGVRIRLAMNLEGQGMGEAASLPWELMRAPKDAAPLVMSNRRVLVRSLDVAQPTEPHPFAPPLRILALVSNPSGTARLDLDEERARITKSWAMLPGVKVDFARPVRAELLRQLAAESYHVIHYMGHGEFSGSAGSLLLEKEDGSPDPITGEELGVFLADELPTLRLVFLNACKTATTGRRSGGDPFAGVAASLIKAGVSAVVAMQFPISDRAAIVFAETFYQRIAQNYPVDAAVAEARKLLYSEENTEWATPVLFLRSKDSLLFSRAGDTETRGGEVPAQPPQGSGKASGSSAADDPWGAAPADALRVFLATPNEKLRPQQRSLTKALEAEGVRVASVSQPPDDAEDFAAALQAYKLRVRSLVGGADLCVHLLGDSAGEPFDEAEALQTYPLEQLRIGLEAARSQLVLIPDEVDLKSLADARYKDEIERLVARPRDAGRFELVQTGKPQLADEIRAKLKKLQEARQAAAPDNASGGAIGCAFVDVLKTDLVYAQKLESFLIEHDIDVTKKTSRSLPGDGPGQFDVKLTQYPLYIVVSGSADRAWVENRWKAATKAATDQDAKAIVAVYSAPVQQPERFSIRCDYMDDSLAKEALKQALSSEFARGAA